MIKKIFVGLAVLGLLMMFMPFMMNFDFSPKLSKLATEYVKGSITELNSQNVVTSVVVTYRGLDTLGEVTVLFLATAGEDFRVEL